PAAHPPTLSVSNDANATPGATIALSSLVTISDPGSVGYSRLELWDANGTAATGQFVVGGTRESGGHEIDVTPADVATAVFDVGTAGGTDQLWARLKQNDGTLTDWQTFAVTAPAAPAAHPPTLSVSNDANATPGATIALSSLVTISDPGSVGYSRLELWDANGTAATGQFVVGGTRESGGHEIDVTPADVATAVFDVGTAGGTDQLWARL